MEESGFIVWLLFRVTLFLLIIVYLIKGLDYLLLDFLYFCRSAFRAPFEPRGHADVTPEELRAQTERPMAVLMVAPHGGRTVAALVESAARMFDYANFHVFVGVPGSDKETVSALEQCAGQIDRLQVVRTNEACAEDPVAGLNEVYRAIQAFEERFHIPFELFVLHDVRSEVHPLSLRYLNHGAEDAVMAQLPLLVIPDRKALLLSSVFVDEFAETYCRNMPVRALLSNALPSAGTGTVFTRPALLSLVGEDGTGPFDTAMVQPAYHAGLRLNQTSGRKRFMQATLPVDTSGALMGWPHAKLREPVAVLERSPHQFGEAVQQKAGRLLGTALQGWRQTWSYQPGTAYFLLRDRLQLLPAILTVAGYAVFLYAVLADVVSRHRPDLAVPPLVEPGEIFFTLLGVVLALYVWRGISKAARLHRLYGPAEAILSLAHLPLAHAVSFCAAVRAVRWRWRSERPDELPLWERDAVRPFDRPEPKEEAEPPHEAATREKLGDLLVSRGLLTPEQLKEALAKQRTTGLKLGEMLTQGGMIDEEDLVFALADQHEEDAVEIDPYATPIEVLGLVPRSLAERYQVFPLGTADDAVVLATDIMETGSRADELSVLLGRPVLFRWTSTVDIAFAIEKAYARAEQEHLRLSERLGERLVRKEVITENQLRKALRRQKRSKQKLGEVLSELGFVSQEQIEEFLS